MSSACKIAFYSPVPGSGASTVCRIYAHYLAEMNTHPVGLVSCDFRYSNVDKHLDTHKAEEGPLTVLLPRIDYSKCILCKACARTCVFGAIRIDKALSYISLRADRCRACGACLNTCRYDAIDERERVIGTWKKHSSHGITFYEGNLLAEDFFAIQLLQQLKKLPPDEGFVLIDACSGLNYPAMESLHGCDLVVMVIDPSTFSAGYYRHLMGILKKYNHAITAVINFRDDAGPEIYETMGTLGVSGIHDFDGPGCAFPATLHNTITELINTSVE